VLQIIIEEIATDALAKALPMNSIEAKDKGKPYTFSRRKNKKSPPYKSFK